MKKILAHICSFALLLSLLIPISSSADSIPRDPNGDGSINISDAVYILQYLAGKYRASNIDALDFDYNGIISKMDVDKVQSYCLGIIPTPSQGGNYGNIGITNNTTSNRTYWKHDYNSTSSTQKTIYTLYANGLENNSFEDEVETCHVIEGNMTTDYDTAVVRLSTGGTGFIIGDHLIATAGHCVFNTNNNTFLNFDIKIINSSNQVIATYEPRYAHITKNFADLPNDNNNYICNYDYALIYVEDDLSQYPKFELGVMLNNYSNMQGSVTVSGFPQSYPSEYGSSAWGIRFKSTGHILSNHTNNMVISYSADTEPGDSGGPVFKEEMLYLESPSYSVNSHHKTVIGINACQSTNTSSPYNSGVRITNDVLKFYKNNLNISN